MIMWPDDFTSHAIAILAGLRRAIYQPIVEAQSLHNGFPAASQHFWSQLVAATSELLQHIATTFIATVTTYQYSFTMREVANVCQVRSTLCVIRCGDELDEKIGFLTC